MSDDRFDPLDFDSDLLSGPFIKDGDGDDDDDIMMLNKVVIKKADNGWILTTVLDSLDEDIPGEKIVEVFNVSKDGDTAHIDMVSHLLESLGLKNIIKLK